MLSAQKFVLGFEPGAKEPKLHAILVRSRHTSLDCWLQVAGGKPLAWNRVSKMRRVYSDFAFMCSLETTLHQALYNFSEAGEFLQVLASQTTGASQGRSYQ